MGYMYATVHYHLCIELLNQHDMDFGFSLNLFEEH